MTASNEAGPVLAGTEPEVTAEPGGRDASNCSTAGATRLDHAIGYASIGWPVLAADPRTKRPIPGCGLSTATTDPERIAAWWRAWPNAVPAVACLRAGLTVVDLDVNHRDGADGLAWWDAQAGAEPNRAFVARTPAGGRHLVFAAPDGPELRSGRIAPGVDVKAGGGEFGGYVVLPSTGDDGREWEGDDPRDGGALTPPPQWFVDIARAKLPPQNDAPKSTNTTTTTTAHHAGAATDERFAEVRSALDAIPPSIGRDEWLRAIHGAHAALGGDPRGAGLVESWSAGTTVAGQYKAGEPVRIYRHARPPQSAAPGGRQLVDGESLFGLAYANGWAGPDVEQQEPAEVAPAPAAADGRPVVVTSTTEHHAQRAKVLEALAKRQDIAQRDGFLVRVTPDARGGPDRVVPLSRGMARDLLSRAVRWRATPTAKAPLPPPQLLVADLAERGDWAGIRRLPRSTTPVRSWHDVAQDASPPWLVGDLLAATDLAVIASPANQGKSLQALDLALSLQHGRAQWMGYDLPTDGASTLYLVGEGFGGQPKRLRAWAAAHPGERPVAGRYCALRDGIPSLTDPDAFGDLADVILETAEAFGGQRPNLVIVDTLAAAVPGADENSAQDLGRALDVLASIRRTYGCAVLVLHHVHKGAPDRPLTPHLNLLRGSSTIGASVDAAVILDDGTFTVVKGRDVARGSSRGFAVLPIETGRVDDGRPEVGAYVVRRDAPLADASPDIARRARLDAKVQAVVDAATDHGAPVARETLATLVGGRLGDARAAVDIAVGRQLLVRANRSDKRPLYVVRPQDGDDERGGGETPHTPPVGTGRDASAPPDTSRRPGRDRDGTGRDDLADLDTDMPAKPKGKRSTKSSKRAKGGK